jgi:hypothetical protein
MRVRHENRRARSARRLHCRDYPVVHGDEATKPERDRVRGALRVRIVVRQLEPRHEQESVGRECAGTLALELGEVGAHVRLVETRASVPERPRIVATQDVVGDAEDVEAGGSVKVDHRPEGKLAVTPSRMGVELAEQGAYASAHSP